MAHLVNMLLLHIRTSISEKFIIARKVIYFPWLSWSQRHVISAETNASTESGREFESHLGIDGL